jgi:hypothetical protein
MQNPTVVNNSARNPDTVFGDLIPEALPVLMKKKLLEKDNKPEVFTDDAVLTAICNDIEKVLGWKNLVGSTRSNLKLLLPIIQKHMR